LRQLIAGDQDNNAVLQGWRREIVGEKLLRLLQTEKTQA